MFVLLVLELVIMASALQLHSSPEASDVCRFADTDDNPACCPVGAREDFSPAPKVKMKVIVATTGCSGSTELMKIAEEIHSRANITLAPCNGHREILRDILSGIHYQGYHVPKREVFEYLKQLVMLNSAQGLPLLFKDPHGDLLRFSGLADFVRNEGKAIVFVRSNLIDIMLCHIKDGFNVFNSGTNAEIGTCSGCGQFRNRGAKEKEAIGRFVMNEEKILPALWQLAKSQSQRALDVLTVFPQEGVKVDGRGLAEEVSKYDAEESLLSGVFTFEDLFAFEWDSNAVERSSLAWYLLLRALGSDVDEAVIRNYLHENTDRYARPGSHSSQIENYVSVKAELTKCAEKYPPRFCRDLENMWRD